MAKIGKFTKYSNKLGKSFTEDVHYHVEKSRHSTSGFFFMVIPDEFNALHEQYEHARKWFSRGVNKIIIEGKTGEEVIERYAKYMEMYSEAKTVTEKVILYRYKFSSKDKSSDPTRSGSMMGVSKTYEAQIEFDFCVCDKTNFHGKITYAARDMDRNNYRQSRDSFGIPQTKAGASYGAWVELPHTPEAEEFFKRIYTGMENIMTMIEKFIGTDVAVLQSIESRQKFLA